MKGKEKAPELKIEGMTEVMQNYTTKSDAEECVSVGQWVLDLCHWGSDFVPLKSPLEYPWLPRGQSSTPFENTNVKQEFN